MKHVAYILLFLSPLLGMAQSFEGTIVLKISQPIYQDNGTVTWLIKGGQHKMTMEGNAEGKAYSYTMLMPSDGQVYFVVEKDKTYVKASIELNTAAALTGTVKSTGTAKLGEYNTRAYTVTTANGRTDVWVADLAGLGNNLPVFFANQGYIKSLKAAGEMGFPVKAIEYTASGEVKSTLEVASVTKGSIPASEIELSQYKELQQQEGSTK